jgi:hypothetical protein
LEEYKRPVVEVFLRQFKAAARQSFRVISRRKNRDALLRAGLTEKNRYEEILSLSVEDFHSCEDDKTKGGTVWIFGKQIGNDEFYIKLKFVKDGEKDHSIVISFHPAEMPMRFPFKGAQGGMIR